MFKKRLIAVGGFYAGLAVVLGALGAHWLKENISLIQLQSFETAVRYQMYHGLALLIMASLSNRIGGKLFMLAFHAIWMGVLLFSGSIYILSTRELTGIHLPWLGPVTPIGGILMITGWILFTSSALRTDTDLPEE